MEGVIGDLFRDFEYPKSSQIFWQILLKSFILLLIKNFPIPPLPSTPPTPPHFFYLPIKYIEIDVFRCSRCLNDFINVFNMIGPFPSWTFTPWWWKLRLNNHSWDIFNFNHDFALSGGKILFHSFYLLLYLDVQGFHTKNPIHWNLNWRCDGDFYEFYVNFIKV